jgi:hypothetical protein
LYWHYEEDNSEAVFSFRHPSTRWINHLISSTAHTLGKVCGHQKGVIWLDQLHARATLRASYFKQFQAFLQRNQPDIVFCTHQRASRAVPAMLAARQLGIPTATFIYSWDNLPKGRMAVHAEHFFVWSEWMKEELLRYYPELSSGRIHVVGTPQFEHYFNPSLLKARDLFLAEVGLDPSRQVVCFSGDDVASSPHDPIYLADLAEALQKLPQPQRPQILFRRCPVDVSNRYDWVLEKYPEIAVSDPLWLSDSSGDWTQIVPTREDLALLVNVVQHCDVVVNVGSTMAMDFAILGKPGIYINYNPQGINGQWRIENIYRLPHFRSVHKLQPVYWANSATELGELVLRALERPQEKVAARQAWLDLQVKQPMERASKECYLALEKIMKNNSQRPSN